MRIAFCGYAHPFGEGKIYGAEREIYYLMLELREMGHECVAFAVEGCNLPGFEYVVIPKPWDEKKDLYAEAIKEYGPFDMVHSYQASGFIDSKFRASHPYCLEPFFGFHRFKENVISYSRKLNSVNGGGTTVIYFGLPENEYGPPDERPGDYLVWIGRMDMGKAPDIAIEVAKRAGKKLILMGPAYHYPYFVEKIWPEIDNSQIFWLRGVDDEIKRRVFRKAKGFLSTNWDRYHEMFGIVNIEALAAGCPVIGWGHKTEPSAINFEGGEIITHGEHGFINEYADYSAEERERSIEKAVEYVKRLNEINRQKCYELFKTRFTAREMAEKHLKYYSIVKEKGNVQDVTNELC